MRAWWEGNEAASRAPLPPAPSARWRTNWHTNVGWGVLTTRRKVLCAQRASLAQFDSIRPWGCVRHAREGIAARVRGLEVTKQETQCRAIPISRTEALVNDARIDVTAWGERPPVPLPHANPRKA